MAAPPRIELYKPSLGVLESRHHALPVPWEDDAIQLNVVVRDGISLGPLMVTLQEDTIDFSRELDKKLQIHDNVRSVGSPKQRGRTALLARPSGLALHRSVATQGVWLPEGEGLEIVNLDGFNTFLAFVFLGIYKQQHPDVSVAEITKIFDDYPDL